MTKPNVGVLHGNILAELDVDAYISERRMLVNSALQRILNLDVEPECGRFVNAMRYSVLGDGKRTRPILCLATFEIFDNDIEKALAPACGLELLHCASLMLDDLPSMDNASTRRNKLSNHKVYGEGTTILASAALLVTCFKLFAKVGHVKINALIEEITNSLGINGLIKGQFLDLESFNKSSSVEQLEKAYFLKTGVLFCNSVNVGALLGGANQEELAALNSFAKSFGLAFQIRDDILDATAEESFTGKDVRLDVKNKKPSYPSVIGVEQSKEMLAQEMERAKAYLDMFGDRAKLLKGITDTLKL